MIEPANPKDEAQRLHALRILQILDTPPEERFDRITRVAAQLFDVPISVVSMVDSDRQWFKSRHGLGAGETPRAVSFCGHTILQPGVFHVADAAKDPRFADNPLVAGDPKIRFYAGMPLRASGGQAVGTLCLIDTKPRDFSDADRELLGELARWAQETLNQDELKVDPKAKWRWWLGILATLLAVALFDALSTHLYYLPNPPAFLLIAVVFVAYQGGIEAGLASSAIAWIYLAYFFSLPDQPFHYSGDNLTRVLTWAVAIPAIAAMTGLLQRRSRGLSAMETAHAIMTTQMTERAAANAERSKANHEISLAKERLALALEGSNLCLWDWNLEEGTVYLDSAWARMLGEEPHETVLTAAELFDLVHPDDKNLLYARWQLALKGEAAFYAVEHRVRTRSGEWLWIASLGKVVEQTADKRTLRMTGTNADISERKRADARIELLATTDPLTLLPNRRVLADRLAHGMLAADRKNNSAFALLYIDLDRFKTVNDSLGHNVGDEVLKLAAQRIGDATRKADTVARLGGDEFAVVLERMHKPEDAGQVAQKIIDALAAPYVVDGHTLNISCSIGISVFPADAADAATLLRNADLAMYAAKEHGRHTYQYFSPSMNAKVLERVTLERALRDALAQGQFEIHYQPKFSYHTGRLAGVEALLRWHHPQQGLISPARFIHIAEETCMILPIGDWALRSACAQVAKWQGRWPVEMSLAVNISVVQIDGDLVKTVSAALQDSGLEARCLEIEITENVLLRNVDETIEILRQLSDLGVRIAIDDFGTGYSSLSYLRHFKLDTIKIDQSFVGNMLAQENDATIVRAIIALAHSMKMSVVAEGVESTEQKEALAAMGCDEWQGYLNSRPLAADAFEQRFLAGLAPT